MTINMNCNCGSLETSAQRPRAIKNTLNKRQDQLAYCRKYDNYQKSNYLWQKLAAREKVVRSAHINQHIIERWGFECTY